MSSFIETSIQLSLLSLTSSPSSLTSSSLLPSSLPSIPSLRTPLSPPLIPSNELFLSLSYDIIHEIVSYIINNKENIWFVNKHTRNYKHNKHYYRLNKHYSLKYYNNDDNYRNIIISLLNTNQQVSLNLRYSYHTIITINLIIIVLLVNQILMIVIILVMFTVLI